MLILEASAKDDTKLCYIMLVSMSRALRDSSLASIVPSGSEHWIM